ncbi:MAG TPA: EAL domain-containing protein [Chloroflexia bacterium]|nr:EAL domain-containing protein [Chloroflexia bacterium]
MQNHLLFPFPPFTATEDRTMARATTFTNWIGERTRTIWAALRAMEPPTGRPEWRRRSRTTELRRAVDRAEFQVYYQPIVALTSGRVAGFEALVRWQHPQRGLLPPGEFLPLAESSGLIGPISYGVLREACRQLATWQAQWPHRSPLTISVNLSATQLPQPELVAQTLRETGLAPQQLKIEIVENTLAPAAEAEATLHALKALGVRLSIDDFGTGYSSLSYLYRFPADTLKIDRAFVSRLGSGPVSAAIITAIIQLARSLGMDTVAEGVETAEQRDLLQALGCDYGQGWLFAPALTSPQAAALLALLPDLWIAE